MAVTLAGMLQGALGPTHRSDAADLARRIDERRRATLDLTARFIQTYRSGAIGREIVERGVLFMKRPGRMLWEYRYPEKKTFVADGKNFYFYVPAERQVIVRSQAGERGVPALLLSEETSILTEFDVALEEAPPGVHRVRLVPRKPDPEVETVLLDVDPTYRIRTVRIEDAQGNQSRFDFDDLKENVGLKDRLFRFEIPRGVEVITG